MATEAFLKLDLCGERSHLFAYLWKFDICGDSQVFAATKSHEEHHWYLGIRAGNQQMFFFAFILPSRSLIWQIHKILCCTFTRYSEMWLVDFQDKCKKKQLSIARIIALIYGALYVFNQALWRKPAKVEICFFPAQNSHPMRAKYKGLKLLASFLSLFWWKWKLF